MKSKNTEVVEIRLLSWALALIALCSITLAICATAQTREALDIVAEYEAISLDVLAEVAASREENRRLQAEIDEMTKTTYGAEFGYDYGYVVRVVGAEARGEPFEGILAVAQCIADSAERMNITPEEVCKMPNRYAKPVSRAVDLETVNEACLMVFANGERPFNEPIEFFYSTRGGYHSEWHEQSLVFCYEIGNHRFFKRAEAFV